MNYRIQIDAHGPGFLLRRTDENGASVEVELSEDNVLTLAQSAETLRGYILARHTPSGSEDGKPVAAIPAPQVTLNYDPLHNDILLTLIQPNGHQHPFSLPLTTASELAMSLPKWISEAQKSAATKSRH